MLNEREFYDLPDEIKEAWISHFCCNQHFCELELALAGIEVVELDMADGCCWFLFQFSTQEDLEKFRLMAESDDYPSDTGWEVDDEGNERPNSIWIPATDLLLVQKMLISWNELYLDGYAKKKSAEMEFRGYSDAEKKAAQAANV